jgi:spoIIIJ-associated protein
MPPNERRIVHLTLRSNPDVATESTGEGNMRRVTVHPRA